MRGDIVSAAATALVAGLVALMFTGATAPARGREDLAIARARLARMRSAGHKEAESAIAAFRSRAWNPARDARIRTATIDLTVEQNTRLARYRARFDAAKPLAEQVTIETLDEAPGIHPGSKLQAKRFAYVAFLGPYQAVMNPLPPAMYTLSRSAPEGWPIVVTPQFRTTPQTSYRFGGSGLVQVRGEVLDTGPTAVQGATNARILRFTWFEWDTGAVLQRITEDLRGARNVATTDYEYRRMDGFPALSRATLVERSATPGAPDDRFRAEIAWSDIVRE